MKAETQRLGVPWRIRYKDASPDIRIVKFICLTELPIPYPANFISLPDLGDGITSTCPLWTLAREAA